MQPLSNIYNVVNFIILYIIYNMLFFVA